MFHQTKSVKLTLTIILHIITKPRASCHLITCMSKGIVPSPWKPFMLQSKIF